MPSVSAFSFFFFFFSSDKMFIINQRAILKTCFNVMLLSPCPSAFSGISLFRHRTVFSLGYSYSFCIAAVLGVGAIAPSPIETEQLVHSSCAERLSDTSLASEMEKTASRSFPVILYLIYLICARRCAFPAHLSTFKCCRGRPVLGSEKFQGRGKDCC